MVCPRSFRDPYRRNDHAGISREQIPLAQYQHDLGQCLWQFPTSDVCGRTDYCADLLVLPSAPGSAVHCWSVGGESPVECVDQDDCESSTTRPESGRDYSDERRPELSQWTCHGLCYLPVTAVRV